MCLSLNSENLYIIEEYFIFYIVTMDWIQIKNETTLTLCQIQIKNIYRKRKTTAAELNSSRFWFYAILEWGSIFQFQYFHQLQGWFKYGGEFWIWIFFHRTIDSMNHKITEFSIKKILVTYRYGFSGKKWWIWEQWICPFSYHLLRPLSLIRLREGWIDPFFSSHLNFLISYKIHRSFTCDFNYHIFT